MLFQEFVPDTSRYMVMGYTIAFVVIALYVFSLYIRNRNLNRDLTTLEEMDKPDLAKETAPKAAKSVTKRSGKK